MVDEVVAAQGRTEQRSRLLPARLVVYHALALALVASDGYEEVMRRLASGKQLSFTGAGASGSQACPSILPGGIQFSQGGPVTQALTP